MVIIQKRKCKIIPIASGKGGVGKTEMCSNLGILLGAMGYKTVIIDLDLGASNLHTALTMKNTHTGIGNYFSETSLKFDSLMVDTPYQNTKIIFGDALAAGTPNITHTQRAKLIAEIEKIKADYVLLDLGSGSANNVVDFFLMSNAGIIISTPHTTSIVNVYNLMKNAVFRFFLLVFADKSKVLSAIKKHIKERGPQTTANIETLLQHIKKIDRYAAQKMKRYLNILQPSIIFNMVYKQNDFTIAESLSTLIQKNLGISLQSLGAVMHDNAVASNMQRSIPAVNMPDSIFTVELNRIAQKITQSPQFPILPLQTDMYKDSYELTRIELTYDEEEITQTSMKQAADKQALIQQQQERIIDLQNTIRILSTKGPKG